jgi:hypothetical protein
LWGTGGVHRGGGPFAPTACDALEAAAASTAVAGAEDELDAPALLACDALEAATVAAVVAEMAGVTGVALWASTGASR